MIVLWTAIVRLIHPQLHRTMNEAGKYVTLQNVCGGPFDITGRSSGFGVERGPTHRDFMTRGEEKKIRATQKKAFPSDLGTPISIDSAPVVGRQR